MVLYGSESPERTSFDGMKIYASEASDDDVSNTMDSVAEWPLVAWLMSQ